jgi:FkbH-like protein
MAKSDDFIALYGKLTDKFGDNGLISIIVGKVEEKKCVIDTWLMSCRVLKRDMELVMLDVLIEECRKKNLTEIYGQYKRTAKNNMVANLYDDIGFELIESNETEGLWKLEIDNYNRKELTIKIN